MRRCAWSIGTILAVALGLALAGPAAALPAAPWTGQWLGGSGELMTLAQSGTTITGSGPCPGGTTPDVRFAGTASADGASASFTYSSTVCTGTGGTFTGTLTPDGVRVNGTGTTQFGTGFSFTWTYQRGGTEPRSAPPRAPCPGGPWSGLWSGAGPGDVASFVQNGATLAGVLVALPVAHTGTIAGDTARGTFRRPEGTGTFLLTMAPDGLTAGPTTLVAPGRVSITALRRSKCVLVRASSRRPARVLVSIFSGRRSIRLFGQRLVVFRSRGTRQVCIRVPFRAHTFNVRTPLRVALGYAVGATPRRGERKAPPAIRPIRLVP